MGDPVHVPVLPKRATPARAGGPVICGIVRLTGAPEAATVVMAKVPLTPPIVRTTLVSVELEAEDAPRTVKVSPFCAVPALPVKTPAFFKYMPPEIETTTETPALSPDTVIVLDVCKVERAAPVTGVNEKTSGVTSGGAAVVAITVDVVSLPLGVLLLIVNVYCVPGLSPVTVTL